eukprot:3186677-Amphidinium_carterae.1
MFRWMVICLRQGGTARVNTEADWCACKSGVDRKAHMQLKELTSLVCAYRFQHQATGTLGLVYYPSWGSQSVNLETSTGNICSSSGHHMDMCCRCRQAPLKSQLCDAPNPPKTIEV